MKGLTWPNFTGERRTIPGVPSPKGGYGPDVVLPLSEAGVTEEEAAAIAGRTPLELVDIDPEPADAAPKASKKKEAD